MKQLINMHQGANFEVIQKCLFLSEFEPRDSLKLQLYNQFNTKKGRFCYSYNFLDAQVTKFCFAAPALIFARELRYWKSYYLAFLQRN